MGKCSVAEGGLLRAMLLNLNKIRSVPVFVPKRGIGFKLKRSREVADGG
ncbi:MAG: hypothetical protein QOJ51_240 [Acidobacteriaceae bacterium]|jgi:hypothetical protein|nr:hypothetical protein [Acidobacteriaceae bacterium]